MKKQTIFLFLFAISTKGIISSDNQKVEKSKIIETITTNKTNQKNNLNDLYYEWPGPNSPVSTCKLKEQKENEKLSNFNHYP